MKTIPLTQGKFALVDDEDYEWLSQWKWSVKKDGSSNAPLWYACRIQKTKWISMHGLILTAPSEFMIDHINGDGLDNRKSNLRITANQLNQLYSQRLRSTNTSSYQGVSWDKRKRKWRASLIRNGQIKHLGYFDDKLEASKVYQEAKQQLLKSLTINL